MFISRHSEDGVLLPDHRDNTARHFSFALYTFD
jgi:hypothetical protein